MLTKILIVTLFQAAVARIPNSNSENGNLEAKNQKTNSIVHFPDDRNEDYYGRYEQDHSFHSYRHRQPYYKHVHKDVIKNAEYNPSNEFKSDGIEGNKNNERHVSSEIYHSRRANDNFMQFKTNGDTITRAADNLSTSTKALSNKKRGNKNKIVDNNKEDTVIWAATTKSIPVQTEIELPKGGFDNRFAFTGQCANGQRKLFGINACIPAA